MAFNLDALLINVIVSIIVISPALWLSGRIVVGKEKAKFKDAVITVAIGTIVGGVFGALITGNIAAFIQLIIWLALVKKYFECGWLAAFGISILAVIIFGVVAAVLGLIGFTLFTGFF